MLSVFKHLALAVKAWMNKKKFWFLGGAAQIHPLEYASNFGRQFFKRILLMMLQHHAIQCMLNAQTYKIVEPFAIKETYKTSPARIKKKKKNIQQHCE